MQQLFVHMSNSQKGFISFNIISLLFVPIYIYIYMTMHGTVATHERFLKLNLWWGQVLLTVQSKCHLPTTNYFSTDIFQQRRYSLENGVFGSRIFWGPSQYKDGVTGIGIPMLKIRRSRDRLIFNMGIPIPGKDGLYIELLRRGSGLNIENYTARFGR